ncbi:MAG TPA: DUF3426 domain-containing protein, partial [Steroidobacteraceae bacterium]|nr:DUF3426 domain-containing protein [Steroidobacteraceae bacterium]
MYTQCPDCATVFRVTAEALRIAQGDVRCGVCATTFNALENLSEQAFKPTTEAEAPSPDDSMTVEELPGGENIELSAPVELSVVADPPADTNADPEPEPEPAPAPAPAAEREPEVEPEDDERAMEFHGDAADLDRLFVVENPRAVDLDSTDEHPILVLDERDELPEEEEQEEEEEEIPVVESIVLETVNPVAVAPPPPPTPPPTPLPTPLPTQKLPPAAPAPPAPPAPLKPAASGHTAPRILIPDDMRKRLVEEAASRAAADEVFEPDEQPGLLAQRWPWIAGVSVLAFLLVLQIVHSQRDALVQSPSLGPAVAGVYAFLGLSVLTPTDLSAYELRQWGAASDPNEANRLMLRASIVNRAT